MNHPQMKTSPIFSSKTKPTYSHRYALKSFQQKQKEKKNNKLVPENHSSESHYWSYIQSNDEKCRLKKKGLHLQIPHQIFRCERAVCRGRVHTRIYHSLAAQLESNTTFFTIPGHKERAAIPTLANSPIQTNAADVWVIKTWKKSHWPAHTRTNREKNHRHKESPPKTCIGTFARTLPRDTHTSPRTRKLRLCAWVQPVRTRAKLSLVCV